VTLAAPALGPHCPQIRFHLPGWLGVGEALSAMIQAGKLELLQVGGQWMSAWRS